MVPWNRESIEVEQHLLKRGHFVVLDMEMTGLSPAKGGRIIEIAAVRVRNGKIEDQFHTFVDPQLKIPAKITKITGIRNEDLQGQPTIFQVLPQLYTFIGDAVVVCHHVAFDWNRFLLHGFRQVGIFPTNSTFCTYQFFKKVLPNQGRGGYTLDKLCHLLHVPIEQRHRAIDDAVATAQCLLQLIQIFVPDALSNKENHKIEKKEIPHTPVQVKQVRYWEKRKNKREMFRRQYVRLSNGKDFGTVYFDIPTQTWGNKDFPQPLNMEKVEEAVLDFLGLNSREDLLHFRNEPKGGYSA